jgi:FPC/CPF motif-containing protein YcgG
MVDVLDAGTGLADRFRNRIAERAFPCVGAKSAMARGGMTVVTARDIRSSWDDLRLYSCLVEFAGRLRAADDGIFRSFVVIFEGPDDLSEEAFEVALWQRVQSLSDKDEWSGQPYDAGVGADPNDPAFSLSFGGEAFFVVGLHPCASRVARQFESPALVFNPHRQFRALREGGRYEGLRENIIQRDIAFSGSANPMLARHGELSEARQYSGRAVDRHWRCPFSGRRGSGRRGTVSR